MSVRALDIDEATEPLAEYVEQTDKGPFVVTVAGRPRAVVVAIENADMETNLAEQQPPVSGAD